MSNVCKCYRGGNAKGGCQLPIYSDREWPIEAYDGDLDEDLGRFTSNAAAERIIGDLSSASKMPGPTYNLPSSACPMGSRLSKIKGTTCFGCLAADTVEWRKKMGSPAVSVGQGRGGLSTFPPQQRKIHRDPRS